MRLTHRGADSLSNNSKSMSKISDNVSEGSYNQHDGHHHQGQKKKTQIDKFRHTKQSSNATNQANYAKQGASKDIQMDGTAAKTQTFHSDLDEQSYTGGTVPLIGQG